MMEIFMMWIPSRLIVTISERGVPDFGGFSRQLIAPVPVGTNVHIDGCVEISSRPAMRAERRA
jgi:hypothetical protein